MGPARHSPTPLKFHPRGRRARLRLAVAAAIEPSYDLGGDAFDYASNDDRAHLALVDAMGHGIVATLPAVRALASVRHSRRRNLDLEAVHLDASAAVRDPFGDEPFVTADLAELDIEAGRMRWINAGHPPPLLFRRGQAFTELTCAPSARSERPQSAGAWAKSPDADAAGTPHTPRDDRPEERPAEDDSGSRLSLDPPTDVVVAADRAVSG